MSNTTNPIDPRESADTAANVADIQTEPAAAPGGTEPGEPADTADTADAPETSVETHTAPADNGHPVTSTIFRRESGEPYYAYDTAKGGTWAYHATLTRSFTGGSWDGRIRAEFAPRTDKEAANPQGREVLHPLVMEAIFYGPFKEAHRIMRAAVAAVAHKREAQTEKSRKRRAAKAAQNAPECADAANTSPDTAERF